MTASLDSTVLQLGAAPGKPLVRFMADFDEQTTAHPFSAHLRVWNAKALFEVKPVWGSIRLSFIGALSPGQGHGSEALDWMAQLARQHGVAIEGALERQGDNGLTTTQLRSWYRRHGFAVDSSGRLALGPQAPGAETKISQTVDSAVHALKVRSILKVLTESVDPMKIQPSQKITLKRGVHPKGAPWP